MGLARPTIAAMPGLDFYKMVGTGAGTGFSTKPNFARYGLVGVWQNLQSAQRSLSETPVIQRLASRACETVTLYLEPTRSRGQWAGCEPFQVSEQTEPSGPIVALTRATLKAGHIVRFWSLVPAISSAVEDEETQHFMLGLGEIPYRNQITFSIWSDEADMLRFSRVSPTHGEAVRRAYDEGWFAESLFARFNLVHIEGAWAELAPVQSLLSEHFNDTIRKTELQRAVA